MKKILCLTLALIMMLALFGCAKVDNVENDVTQTVPGDLAKGATVACCMGSINHPVHRVVQYGFCTKAQELGMNPIVSGLDEGSIQELIDKWNNDIVSSNAVGALIWTGDDSCYEMMKELKQQGIFTVAPYFLHDYDYAGDCIDKNIPINYDAYGAAMADAVVDRLAQQGISSGSIAVTINYGSGVVINNDNDAFRHRMEELGVDFTILPSETPNKMEEIISKTPDLVAAVGFHGYSLPLWNEALNAAGRQDVLVVGVMTGSEEELESAQNSNSNIAVCMPIYAAGVASAQALYDLNSGLVFSESTWHEYIDTPLAFVGGEGKNDIQTYRDIYDAAQAYLDE